MTQSKNDPSKGGDGRHIPLNLFTAPLQIIVSSDAGEATAVPLADLGFGDAEAASGGDIVPGTGGGLSSVDFAATSYAPDDEDDWDPVPDDPAEALDQLAHRTFPLVNDEGETTLSGETLTRVESNTDVEVDATNGSVRLMVDDVAKVEINDSVAEHYGNVNFEGSPTIGNADFAFTATYSPTEPGDFDGTVETIGQGLDELALRARTAESARPVFVADLAYSGGSLPDSVATVLDQSLTLVDTAEGTAYLDNVDGTLTIVEQGFYKLTISAVWGAYGSAVSRYTRLNLNGTDVGANDKAALTIVGDYTSSQTWVQQLDADDVVGVSGYCGGVGGALEFTQFIIERIA